MPAEPTSCPTMIWPSGAPQWVRCGSPVTGDRCARYGHRPEVLRSLAGATGKPETYGRQQDRGAVSVNTRPAVPDTGQVRGSSAAWQADAALDGRPAEPVTESALHRAADVLRRTIADNDHPHRQAIADVADWLAGSIGAPGSDFPVRIPVEDTGQAHSGVEKLRAAVGRYVDYGPTGLWRAMLNEALIASYEPPPATVQAPDPTPSDSKSGARRPHDAAVQAPDVAALLRFAAAGRREYATNAPADQAAALGAAAATFDQAARIASGDVNSLRSAVPSWRWDEADVLLADDTTPPTEETDRG